ncbi:MAG: N-acetylmuramoyl-L-alanine amidase [Ruminococcaceae bacterium]|nr:N-acetylmuramoyl-L-alanine amidase [Oscillospiraceae bacterium]
MIKKFFALLLTSFFAFSLLACAYIPPSPIPSESEAGPETQEKETSAPSETGADTQAPDTADEIKKGVHIMIDAGHGEIDPGAVVKYDGVTYKEKDINLSVALFLRDELALRGYTPSLIRENDESLLHGRDNIEEIKARRTLAVEKETDLYISLHCNSFDGAARAYGPIVFYREKVDYKAKVFAQTLKDSVTEGMKGYPDTRECRMTRDDDYAVLKTESMPTLLLEMGFLTDESDARQLFDAEWQRTLARAIADGIDTLYDKKYID